MAFGKIWLRTASDKKLSTEREKVRQAYCSSGRDFERASKLQNKLFEFDKEMSRRAWGNEKPNARGIHREHGRNLYKPD